MIKKIGSKISHNKLWLIMIIAAGIRIWLGELVGAWFVPGSPNDDALMVSYACKYNPFMLGSVSVGDMPVKELMYPYYLLLVEASGLSYTMMLSFTWIVAALMVLWLLRQAGANRLYRTIAFIIVLFTPIAFEHSTGTRLYRNAILPPFVLMLFSLAVIILLQLLDRDKLKLKQLIGNMVLLGLLLMFTSHIKEDGIWLLACMLFACVVNLGIIVVRWRRGELGERSGNRLVKMLMIPCIPFLIYVSLTNACRLVNYQLFGVYETNIRTEGELADFVNYVYKVESKNRSNVVWAPADAIEKVFEESETLQQYPQLLDNILHTEWFEGDIYEHPIYGDFLSWVLRDELFHTGLWESERQISDLFSRVNAELEAAFSEGRLTRDDKLQLLSSAGGRSRDEILALTGDMITEYRCAVLLAGYVPGAVQNSMGNTEEEITLINTASALTNMDFSSGLSELESMEIKIANILVRGVFGLYRVLQPFLCILAAAGFGWSVALGIGRFRKRVKAPEIVQEQAIVLTVVVLIGISLAYAFAIAWFSSFIYGTTADSVEVLKFYGVGLIPIMSLIELLGSFLFLKRLEQHH